MIASMSFWAVGPANMSSNRASGVAGRSDLQEFEYALSGCSVFALVRCGSAFRQGMLSTELGARLKRFLDYLLIL